MKFASSYEPGDFETDIYAAWEKAKAFLPSSTGEDYYSIVMPPPNANGNLHIGHGLTIALEDSLTRYYRLRGRNTWYVPGADHAGFETWVVYEKTLEKVGKTRFQYTRDELYRNVYDFVAQQRGNMELQLRALGASADWDNLTFTLDEKVVKRVYKTFSRMFEEGMVYRGEKLVNYCPKHRTAFADIEVEHVDEEGVLYDIRYSDEIVVSTTRPETLFGDTAVAVNPNDERYKKLVGTKVKLPLTDREIPIIADEHADMEYGTGAVKITPAHDFDDFEVGERHNLPRIRVIDDAGRVCNAGEPYDGLPALEARKRVVEALREQKLLLKETKITHAVAHCYKCGEVIEPTLKAQWFVDVKKLAKEAIKHIQNNEIKFYPASKKKVLVNYLKNLKDWNISRQIPWGIPIPMYRKATAGQINKDEWVFSEDVEKEEITVDGVKYIRDEDTFDTWFSSSHWPIVCTDWTEGEKNPFYPLNVMETGADILFAWVARMIMMGVYVTGEVPFREVYLHGLVLDEHGKKMSKSKGNVINPIEMVSKYGSDAFRMGILRGRSAGLNQAFSEQSVEYSRNLCNKVWNISRFVEGMVSGDESGKLEGSQSGETGEFGKSEGDDGSQNGEFGEFGKSEGSQISEKVETASEKVETVNMGEDWIVREIQEARKAIEKDFEKYRFAEALETIETLVWDKYAGWFLESQKIYKNVPLLKETLTEILIMLHPFAPFLTEAIWQNLSFTEGMIINQKWPGSMKFDPISAENFARLQEVVTEARKVENEIFKVSGERFGLLYGDDALVDDNSLLVAKLAGAPTISTTNGQPRGIRLAIYNHEVYLDVPAEVVASYKNALTERILAVGRELDGLRARMMNPNYVRRAPAELVKETRDGIEEKEALIERLKKEIEVI